MSRKKKQGMSFKVGVDPTKRKMSPEELKAYLRENSRGTGPHSSKKGKRGYDRRRDKKKQEKKLEGGFMFVIFSGFSMENPFCLYKCRYKTSKQKQILS
ncbi:MAG: hypothetical protein R6V40_01610 [Candidatus Moraniibacteriota bacterium]